MVATELTIQDWLEGSRANKRKAQEALFRHFYAFAMNLAMRYSKDDMDAADIVSTAFIKIFKSLHSYDSSKGSLHAWIKRIVVNEGLDHIKSRARFSEQVELEAISEPAVNNAVIEQMGATEIMALVQKLPPATHAVFVSYAVEGYNHREIAVKLGISEGTSKWHLSEARKMLKELIQRYES